MDVFNEFATDLTKEVEGVVHFLRGKDSSKDPWIRVARTGNEKYSALLTELFEQNREALQAKTKAGEELAVQLMVEVMARTILLDHGNLTFKGAPVPAGVAGREMLLGVKDFRALVQKKADDMNSYRAVALEADSGN